MDFSHPDISEITLIRSVGQEVLSSRYLPDLEQGQVAPVHHLHLQDVDPLFLLVVVVAHRHQTVTQRLEITGTTRFVN